MLILSCNSDNNVNVSTVHAMKRSVCGKWSFLGCDIFVNDDPVPTKAKRGPE